MPPTRQVGAAASAAIAIAVIICGKGPLLTAGKGIASPPTFPYPHMSVETAEEANSPIGTVFVTVDDGTARPVNARGHAVPTDGTPSRDAAYNDPSICDRIKGQPGVCWRYWQVVGDGVQVWTFYRGRSCVVIGSIGGEQTRVLCDGVLVES